MKSLASFVFVAAALAAQPRIGAPVMGYVFDASTRSLRPIAGFPGASLIGSPTDLRVSPAWAAVSPRQDFAILGADDGSVQRVSLATGAASDLPGAGSGPVFFSPSGDALALYRQDAGKLQIYAGTSLAREIVVPGEVTAAAVSDDGEQTLLISDGAAWLSTGGGDPVPLGVPASAAAFRSGSHQAAIVTQDGQVSFFPDGQAARPAPLSDPVAVRFSADGGTVFIAGRDGTIVAFAVNSGNASAVSCGCTPSGLFPLRSPALFRLNEAADDPVMLLDASGAQLRTWFVPALERSAQ